MDTFGVIGLGTMGANLARNAARNGATVPVFNRTAEKTDAFMKNHGSEGGFIAAKTYEEFVDAFSAKRVILIMVKAGEAVDGVISDLLPLLQKGDIFIDGGNSHFHDTERRCKYLKEKGMGFIGMGVSGGEEGALNGPSMMPGGDEASYREVVPLLTRMAADDGMGGKCVTYVGPGGAGHFVKMVHNGIEYGLMQLIAESYDVLKNVGKLSNSELSELFAAWNATPELQSFLIEITAKIFAKKEGKGYLLDRIKDQAGQKGTGKWTTQAALDLGVAIPTINAAVDARILSGSNSLRNPKNKLPYTPDLEEPVPQGKKMQFMVGSALHLSSLCTYMQGFTLIEAASEANKWNIPVAECARLWLGGCIIRSAMLKVFLQTMSKDSAMVATGRNTMMEYLAGERQVFWRQCVELAASNGIPTPAISASLHYYDSMRQERLPQNLIQAQRDFFGAHTYERTDKKGRFHTDWGG